MRATWSGCSFRASPRSKYRRRPLCLMLRSATRFSVPQGVTQRTVLRRSLGGSRGEASQ